ncbi:hypothetical protein, variant [Capsaspora owczarzaki ATCC 30864]|nr:hypothetical protein, variant [Capsaspora owczarzaki ATCC 30864]
MPAAYNADDRTIYVEGFPKTTTIDHLRAFFEPYSHVLAVRLPKFHGGDPKGFAFVELALLEDVDRVLQELSDRPFSVPDVPSDPSLAEPLRIMTLAEWSDFKDSYKQIKKLVAKETKKQRAKQTQQALVLPPGRAAGQVKSVQEPYRTPFVPGVIIQLTELSPDSSKAGIAKELAHHGQVKFVEYTAGQAVASVRCVDASSAQAILRAAHSQAFPFKVSELRGGAEKKFWQTLWSAQDAKHSIKPAVKNEPFKSEVEPERPASHTAASKRSLSESLESDAIVAAQPSSSTTTEAPAAKKRRTTRRKKKSHGAATGAAARVHTFFEIEEEERDDQGENE